MEQGHDDYSPTSEDIKPHIITRLQQKGIRTGVCYERKRTRTCTQNEINGEVTGDKKQDWELISCGVHTHTLPTRSPHDYTTAETGNMSPLTSAEHVAYKIRISVQTNPHSSGAV